MISKLLRNVLALYGPTSPARLTALYSEAGGPFGYLGKFWTTQDFDSIRPKDSQLARLVGLGMLGQLIAAGILIRNGVINDRSEFFTLAAAVILAAPVVWAHALFVGGFILGALDVKKVGKTALCLVLEWQILRLRKKHKFTLVAVAGSVGKTSTKLAVAKVLAAAGPVRYQEGNYNDRLTVPLVLFGQEEPGIFNIPAWVRILLANERLLKAPQKFKIAVLELGTDGPGQMKDFAYLKPEIGVVTAVAEEHMEQFGTLDTVAEEELSVFEYAKTVLVNVDAVDEKYLRGRTYKAYSTHRPADFTVKGSALSERHKLAGRKLELTLEGAKVTAHVRLLGKQAESIGLAAASVASLTGLTPKEITRALEDLPYVPGRMQVLDGRNGSILIDDTYNASPMAVKAALDVVYASSAEHRLAVLGSMNELGEVSERAHTEVGAYCDPKKLDMVLTIGAQAKQYIAPAAAAKGCVVKTFDSPYAAGLYLKGNLPSAAVVLFKGSQNGVFAEEALKQVLADSSDAKKLVRQSASWQKIKQSQFGAR